MLTLHQNEKVLATYRKTWLVFFATTVGAVSAAVLPLLLLPFAERIPLIFVPFVPLGTVLWWWMVWLGGFLAFVNYYLDVFVVTSERIIHIEQHGPFSRTIAELRLERVQDVTVEQHGILATLLHFGNLRVQTAAEASEFIFFAIPHPLRAKEIIMEAHRTAVLQERRHTST